MPCQRPRMGGSDGTNLPHAAGSPRRRLLRYDGSMAELGRGDCRRGTSGADGRGEAASRCRTLFGEEPRPGVKIFLSGGTRCNLTHATETRGIVEAFGPAGRFLHSALAAFGPEEVVDLFEAEGVPTKVEPAARSFPQAIGPPTCSRRSCALGGAAARRPWASRWSNVSAPATGSGSSRRGGRSGRQSGADPRRQVVPGCGTTGDGYAWAAALGHKVVTPRAGPRAAHPTPLGSALKGITMPDVVVKVIEPAGDSRVRPSALPGQRRVVPLHAFRRHGPGGPRREPRRQRPPAGSAPGGAILPAAAGRRIEALLARQCRGRPAAARRRSWTLGFRSGSPSRRRAGRRPGRSPRGRVVEGRPPPLGRGGQALDIPLAGTMGFRKAEVTAGGVALEEVDSRTMQSKLVPACISPASCSTWTDRSAATISRPPSAPAGSPARAYGEKRPDALADSGGLVESGRNRSRLGGDGSIFRREIVLCQQYVGRKRDLSLSASDRRWVSGSCHKSLASNRLEKHWGVV